MGITLKDIANYCGVSSATVSMVVNEKAERLSWETQKKVKEAIKKLGYTPNLAARTMVTKSTKTIGLMVTDVSDYFYGKIAKGVGKIANENGYDLILASTEKSLEKEQKLIKVFKSRGVDGIIFTPLNSCEEDAEFDELYKEEYPFVTIERYLLNADIPSVKINNFQGMFDLTKLFLDKGHKKFAFVKGPKGVGSTDLRYQGFVSALNCYNIKLDPSLVFEGDYTYESGLIAGAKFLTRYTPDITAIIVSNNDMEYGFYEAIAKVGLNINKNISIAGGGGGVDQYSIFNPKFTSIDTLSKNLGEKATKILLQIMNKEKNISKLFIQNLEIQDRGSILNIN
ncbi:MAG: LacI family DNA-binding transcriptional regulator [Sphaerochaetaceae bacterium]|nr:LacI family DNA-binding transcriptional regulator [Sphaerochaetaceae bacterium]